MSDTGRTRADTVRQRITRNLGGPAGTGPAATLPTGLRHGMRAFRHRDFRIFFLGAAVSNSGSWLQNLAVPFVLFELTGVPERMEQAKRFVYEGLEAGDLKPIVARTFPLDEIVAAHRYMESNEQIGKIVVLT